MYMFEAPLAVGEVEREVLVVFSGQLEGDEIDYSQLIEAGYKRFENRPEEVLFVYPAYISHLISEMFSKGSRCYENIIRYGADIPVTFLAFDLYGNFAVQEINLTSSLCGDLDSLRNQVVDRGVYSLARSRKNEVILKAPSGTVFIKPSSQEYDEFIKASELAVGYAENQFIGFSLLSRAPKDREIKRIYIDTNSISSFIESLLYYWSKFLDVECKPAVYHSYGSYGGMDKAKPEDSDDVWLIISASRSNSMGVKMASDWNLVNDQVLTLLSYTDSRQEKVGDEILVNIAPLSESAENGLVHGSLMKVKVWGENFTAEVEKPNPVVIRAAHKTPAISSLVVPNNSNGLFKLNRKVSAEFPVSPVYINCSDSTIKKYAKWLDKVIDWYVPPGVGWLVYREAESSSKSLVKYIADKLKANGITNFQTIDIESAGKSIKGDDCVVVIMPVTGSGQTLLKLNRNLRISGHSGNRIFISPFVMAPSKASFDQFKNSLVYGPNNMKYLFFSWKNVYIGHTDEENSWTQELYVVEHLNSEFWRVRATALRNQKDGLKGAIGTPSLEVDERLEFTRDFAFWSGKEYTVDTVNHEAVYLSVSSILQGLREKPFSKIDTDSLFSYVYQHAVIAPDNFTRFSDALLQSCLWRAANMREMDYRSSSSLSQEFAEIIERLIEENSEGVKNAAVDLLMGIATGRIQLAGGVLRAVLDKASKVYSNNNENAMALIGYINGKYFPDAHLEGDEEVIVV